MYLRGLFRKFDEITPLKQIEQCLSNGNYFQWMPTAFTTAILIYFTLRHGLAELKGIN